VDPNAPPKHPLRVLPAAVEAHWLAEARRVTGGADDVRALEGVLAPLAALSDGFTSARPTRFARYGNDLLARAAYDLWFGAQAWVRTPLPLGMARAVHGWAPPTRPLRVLDVGSGSGAAGLSAAAWLAQAGSGAVEVVALDHARGALLGVERLAEVAFPAAARPRVTTHVLDVRDAVVLGKVAPGPFDLIVVSFTFNELWPAAESAGPQDWLTGLLEKLAPEGLLLVLEPAPKEQALRLVDLAASLVEAGLAFSWGPHQGVGAWRPPPDPRTWPHEVRRWTVPASLVRLNRALWRSVAELTFSYALLGRRSPPPPPGLRYRLASAPRRLKGRRHWLAWDDAGSLVTLELQDRDATREQRDRLEAAERGDLWTLAAPPRAVGDALRLGAAADVIAVLTPETP
jgi:SAM-dependent methyltransferase